MWWLYHISICVKYLPTSYFIHSILRYDISILNGFKCEAPGVPRKNLMRIDVIFCYQWYDFC